MSARADALPLRSRTTEAWARAALTDPVGLLDDHAHLERKAAANALGLLSRWPQAPVGVGGEGARRVASWTRRLTGVARDEIEHLGLVLRILEGRGASLGRVHRNPYAAALRALVRQGRGVEDLVDRLLVSALIEARSCERFERLGQVAQDEELRRLYRGLEASERGHHRLFLELAGEVEAEGTVALRWDELLGAEARILAAQEPGARMHSGEPAGGRGRGDDV